jgi:radical SAM superfamily enzyme YgiQ (UPF0313 family)
MRILLVSTYELGHQPIHLASPAAALEADGHAVVCLDLSVQEAELGVLDGVGAVAFSVPMHTAMRLAIATARRIKTAKPELPVAFYGLYADVGREANLGIVTDAIFCGEYEPALVSWASSLEGHRRIESVQVHLGKSEFRLPLRVGLPSLDNYARLEHNGSAKIVGAVEASHGCRHRCRHCPIPAVYDGRLRILGEDLVLADIAQLVAMGAEHITFADADFLNAPAYSMGLLRNAHAEFPSLTFDITVKVEHILKYREMWSEMASLNVLFVVSAFESVDNDTLEILDKGHTVSDMVEAVEILRHAGIFLRPTWLPFLPWTTPQEIARLMTFLDDHGLASAIDPVQLSIRVLIPEGSLLVAQPEIAKYLSHFDAESLTWSWEFKDPATARLHKELDRIAGEASDCQQDAGDTLLAMRDVISSISGIQLGKLQSSSVVVPRLSESWFCCAEPTVGQSTAILGVSLGGSHG